MKNKFRIHKGDQVYVIAGSEKGKTGEVLAIDTKNARVTVKGVKIVGRNVKPSAENPEGGIVRKEASIHISNVALIDPESQKPTRIGIKIENGEKQRIAKKSGAVIAKPVVKTKHKS